MKNTKHLWSVEENDDLARTFSEELAKEIDREILNDILAIRLIKEGWVQPSIPYVKYRWPFNDRLAEIGEWVHLHATGDYRNINGKWVFENPADATAFTLKWA
jgi:hypothetical protein